MSTLASAVMQARLKAVLQVDVSDRLGRLKMPVLYLRALVDKVVPRRSSKWLGDRLPRMKIVEIKAPHFLLKVCPQAAAEVVDAFILELEVQGK
jgi:pimeloyl-ACP methyl ester carboxylesterase